MKDTSILYLNDQHEKIVDMHVKNIKKVMYFATEDCDSGKYQDFLDILNSIYQYSNNFYKTMLNKDKMGEGAMAEFIFLIPNMSFYTAIGFLTALKDGYNNSDMMASLEKIGMHCENATSELADVMIDENEKKKILKDILDIQLSKN